MLAVICNNNAIYAYVLIYIKNATNMAQPGEQGYAHDAQLRSEAKFEMPGTVGLWQRIWSRPTNSSLASGGDLVYQERHHHRRHDHRLVQFFYLKKVGTRTRTLGEKSTSKYFKKN